jgi:hypothetical protein
LRREGKSASKSSGNQRKWNRIGAIFRFLRLVSSKKKNHRFCSFFFPSLCFSHSWFSGWIHPDCIVPFKKYFKKYAKTKDQKLRQAIEDAVDDIEDEALKKTVSCFFFFSFSLEGVLED